MRTVITHSENGIFVGTALGLAFFSKLDAVGQPRVSTFEDEADARNFISSWDDKNNPDDYSYVNVETSDDYADIEVLARAGLSDMLGHLLEYTPTMARC